MLKRVRMASHSNVAATAEPPPAAATAVGVPSADEAPPAAATAVHAASAEAPPDAATAVGAFAASADSCTHAATAVLAATADERRKRPRPQPRDLACLIVDLLMQGGMQGSLAAMRQRRSIFFSWHDSRSVRGEQRNLAARGG